MTAIVNPPVVPLVRHPLGLPAGSVRAAIALMIAAIFWFLLLLPAEKSVTVPLYLYFLFSLVLTFFASHGHSIAAEPGVVTSPWGMPRGTFRFLILAGTAAVVAWRFHEDPTLLRERLTPTADELWQAPQLLLALLGGYGLGWLIGLGPWRRLGWFQDIEAWFSLLAMLGLGAEMVVVVLIRPNLAMTVDLPLWQTVLVAIVSFYFGVRS